MKDIQVFSEKLAIDLSVLIRQARQQVAHAVNSTMIVLYWNIGKHIREDFIVNDRAEYGERVMKNLGEKLTAEHGRGFGYRNLLRMVNFYNTFPDFEIVTTLSSQLSWSHLVELIKIKDDLQRDFYLTMCMNEHWSVRQLSERMNSMLFERTAISKKPAETIAGDLKKLREEKDMSVDLFLKDPLILDFLSLSDRFSEQDLEAAILAELEKFILEMGSDFAFLSRQKRITIDDEDFYIDLLFFHRKLRRLCAIELKLGKFKPKYKSQLELYLKWLDKYERQEGENPPIGVLLCADKKEEMIELLELDKSNIHVSQYITSLPSKEEFRQKLLFSIQEARKRLSTIPLPEEEK